MLSFRLVDLLWQASWPVLWWSRVHREISRVAPWPHNGTRKRLQAGIRFERQCAALRAQALCYLPLSLWPESLGKRELSPSELACSGNEVIMPYDPNRFYNAKQGQGGTRTYGECGGHDSLGFSNTLCPQAGLTPSVRHGRAHFNGSSQTDHIVFNQTASAVRTPVRIADSLHCRHTAAARA